MWENVTTEQWNSWKWQIANRITTVEELEKVVNLTTQEKNGINPREENSEKTDDKSIEKDKKTSQATLFNF